MQKTVDIVDIVDEPQNQCVICDDLETMIVGIVVDTVDK